MISNNLMFHNKSMMSICVYSFVILCINCPCFCMIIVIIIVLMFITHRQLVSLELHGNYTSSDELSMFSGQLMVSQS